MVWCLHWPLDSAGRSLVVQFAAHETNKTWTCVHFLMEVEIRDFACTSVLWLRSSCYFSWCHKAEGLKTLKVKSCWREWRIINKVKMHFFFPGCLWNVKWHHLKWQERWCCGSWVKPSRLCWLRVLVSAVHTAILFLIKKCFWYSRSQTISRLWRKGCEVTALWTKWVARN